MTKRHQWRTYWRVVQTYSGVYLSKQWYFEHLGLIQMFVLRFCNHKKIKWFLLRLYSDLLEISSKGLYFYITQLPIRLKLFRLSLVLDWMFGLILLMRPNCGLILKIRPNACRHLKNLCKLGLRPKFGLRTKSDLFYQVTQRENIMPPVQAMLHITCEGIKQGYHSQTMWNSLTVRGTSLWHSAC